MEKEPTIRIRVEPGEISTYESKHTEDVQSYELTPTDREWKYSDTNPIRLFVIRTAVWDRKASSTFEVRVSKPYDRSIERHMGTILGEGLGLGEPGAMKLNAENTLVHRKIAYRSTQDERGIIHKRYDQELHGDLYQLEVPLHIYEAGEGEWLKTARPGVPDDELAKDLHPLYVHRYPKWQIQDPLQMIANIEALEHNGRPTLVTVSGLSGSGKTHFAKMVSSVLGAAYISADNYHIGREAAKKLLGKEDFDDARGYNLELVAKHLLKLIHGEGIFSPIYDYESEAPSGSFQFIEAPTNGLVVMDSLYGWHVERYDKTLQSTRGKSNVPFNVRHVVMDTPPYVSIARRLIRDLGILDSARQSRILKGGNERWLSYLVSVGLPKMLEEHAAKQFEWVVR